MSLIQQQLDDAVGRWPDDDSLLPAHAQAVYQAWRTLRVRDAQTASHASPIPLTTGRMRKDDRCRLLTLSRTPFPPSTPSPPPLLTAQQVLDFGDPPAGGEPNQEVDDGSPQEEIIRQLQIQLQAQKTAIDRLLVQQESLADDTPAHNTYPIVETTLQ